MIELTAWLGAHARLACQIAWIEVGVGIAFKLYFIGWALLWRSSLFLKEITLGADTTSLGRLFHMSITEFVKTFLYLRDLQWVLVSLKPFDLVFEVQLKSRSLHEYISLAYLNTLIMSPHMWRKVTDGKLSWRSLSSYGRSFIAVTILFALCFTFSSSLCNAFVRGH